MLTSGIRWNFYYFIPLGLAVASLPLIWLCFRGYHPPEEEHAIKGADKRLLLAVRNPVVLMGGLLAALVSLLPGNVHRWILK